jgi:hypothetical protein
VASHPTARTALERLHHRHAVIETVFADLIDGPLAHMPSERFGVNSARVLCAAIAHNLLHAAGTLASDSPRSPAARPCNDRSSPCRPDSPAPHAHRSCTCHGDGPGLRHGHGPHPVPLDSAATELVTRPRTPAARAQARPGPTASAFAEMTTGHHGERLVTWIGHVEADAQLHRVRDLICRR